ncbi:shikimate kinase [Ornithinimicrobium sufpigmenti]|uniref:shikimate kinase n=1 Tax=Ornithinimicrobium sufpigmenti TaxID=2508882 RepID=UPI001036C4C9|nr:MULTISPECIES: RNase adapter RapZ [unclassified Ornithinimicrobium]
MTATRVLVTGMSGTGKSTVLAELGHRGWHAVDADADGLVDEHPDRTELRLPELEAILAQPLPDRAMVVAATGGGQERLYPLVDHVVLLTASWKELRQRIATRTDNRFGQDPSELERIRADREAYEPLLRQGADLVIDTSAAPLEDVVDRIDALATIRGGDR